LPLDDAERQTLLAALERQHWRMTQTAEHLGISRNTLYRKLRKHGINPFYAYITKGCRGMFFSALSQVGFLLLSGKFHAH